MFQFIRDIVEVIRISRLKKRYTPESYPNFHGSALDIIDNVRKHKRRQFVRNALAATIRRLKYEFQPEDFSEAKWGYIKYQKNNPINDVKKIKLDDWVTVISETYYTKGKRWCEYHKEYDSAMPHKTFQVKKIFEAENYVSYDGKYKNHPAEQVRFATAKEIKQAQQLEIEKQQELLHEEISAVVVDEKDIPYYEGAQEQDEYELQQGEQNNKRNE